MKKLKFQLSGLPVLALGLLVAGGFWSCTKDFDEINKNPNGVTADKVDPSFQLTNVMFGTGMDAHIHQRIQNLYCDIFAQYFANEGFSSQRYIPVDGWTNDYWSAGYYNGWVANLNDIIRNEGAKDNKGNAYHIARIYKALVVTRATDLFGDIPYFKAADGTGENPPYDKVKDIYVDLLRELKEASAGLSTANLNIPANQDLIFHGDVSKWKKFANSLRLRLAVRLSEVDPATAKQHAEEAVAAEGGVMQSREDACVIPKSPSYGWGRDNALGKYYGWGGMTMSRTMENLMVGLGGQAFPGGYTTDDQGLQLSSNVEHPTDPRANRFRVGVPSKVDPRGPLMFEVTTTGNGGVENDVIDGQNISTVGRWAGVPAGLPSTASGLTQYSNVKYARLAAPFRDAEFDYTMMPYEEVCFLQAEGAYRGWNMGGSAKSFYEAGVRASMARFGLSGAPVDAYLASTDENTYGTTVNYDFRSGKTFLGKPADGSLQKIMTQKYISMFPDGSWEAWNDHRRVGLPIWVAPAAPDAGAVTATDGSPGNFIKRIAYPTVEAINNGDEYGKAVAGQGPDKVSTRLWWDLNVWWDKAD
ncbi:MAG: SusD/RagB family nutrient-binding outer membrane lipoprotein [Bacteroidota bacterium]|jgi:hypothetical protein|nr:SusD/RagB family nutrient-binding outer membrane lipoprotein [Saprospiraceae bacterium]